MIQEIVKTHREALQYMDEYTGGEITNETVKAYMNSKTSDLPVREQIQRVINVLEEEIEMQKPKMTYKEELQAEKLKLEKREGSLKSYKVQLALQIEFLKPSRIMLGKEPISEVMLSLTKKTNSELVELNQKIQSLEAKINRL